MPTKLSSSALRWRASSLFIPMWSSSASVIWRPMVSTGLREVIGSWKIMATLLPLTWRISSSLSSSRLRPSNSTSPATILPGGWGTGA